METQLMIALTISLTECQEGFSDGQFEKKRVILSLSGADVRSRFVGIDS